MQAFLSLVAVLAAATQSQAAAAENPIRRIVNLLQMMQKEVAEDGEKDEDTTEKFLCYCQTNDKTLAEGIAALEDQIPQIEASIKEAEAYAQSVDDELAQHKQDRADAKATIESATSQREKEAAEFAKLSGDLKANIAACGKAVTAISKGMGAAFLQSGAKALRQIVVNSNKLDRYSRQVLTEFLEGGYAPASGEIVGILKQLLEDMEGDLKEATDTETAAVAEFEGLVDAKEKSIQAATEAIESKLERKGQLAVEIVNKKNDLEDAKDSLAEDQAFLAGLKKDCATKESEFEERKAARSEELVAIAETIKILNDDDALELFKKTLPSPSLLQLTASDRDVRDDALAALQVFGKSSSPKASYILLALLGKKVGMEKIIKLIDDLVVTLKKEQEDDDAQKEWCAKEFDVSEDKQKELKHKSEDLTTAIDETTSGIATLKDELKALADGIVALDKMVGEATDTRKTEHEEFVTVQAQNNGAVQLLEVAKNRLNKLYNPKLYKAPPKRELTEEERLYVASGGVLTTPAPGGIAGTGVTVFSQVNGQVAPAPPPATSEAYKKKDAGGPIALIDSLKNDLEKDIQMTEMTEKEAQKDYEELMAESAAKRQQDSKTITEKESQKAGLEADLETAKKDKADTVAELMALGEYVATLHGSCDFLIDNFSLRQEARANEIDALGKAKAVLNGADYSLMQVKASTKEVRRFLLKTEQTTDDTCAEDKPRRASLLQSLTALQQDVMMACNAMCNAQKSGACDCPDLKAPRNVESWKEIYGMFDQLKVFGSQMVQNHA